MLAKVTPKFSFSSAGFYSLCGGKGSIVHVKYFRLFNLGLSITSKPKLDIGFIGVIFCTALGLCKILYLLVVSGRI